MHLIQLFSFIFAFKKVMAQLKFQSFGSGSSGNCYFIGNSNYGFLIDAGIGIRNIKKYLYNIGLNFENILGVFITHDHADHIKSVGVLGEKYHIPIFTTKKVHESIQKSFYVNKNLTFSKKIIEKWESVIIEDFCFTAFPVSHDATDSVGYVVIYKEKKFVFATDLGYISNEIITYLTDANYLVLEANYDEKMLWDGSYPFYLKKRISSNTGHLSNDQAGIFLSENYQEKLKNIFLCHLSKENNLPTIAYNTVQKHLENNKIIVGKNVQLNVLERSQPSNIFIF